MMNDVVKQKFDTYPVKVRAKLEYLRQLILEVAANTNKVGEVEETLKWGEPAYITLPIQYEDKSGKLKKAKAPGTTIRIDWKTKSPDQYALYVNCQTSLIDSYNSLFPNTFTFEGSRAVVFRLDDALPEEALRVCIQMALTYHLDK